MPNPTRFPKPYIAFALLLAGCAASGEAGRSASSEVRAEILPERIAGHVAVLASDAYEGRAPGTEGEVKTVAYIGDAFRSAGLTPIAGDDYRLPVPLMKSEAVSGTLSANGVQIANSDASFVRAAATSGKSRIEGDTIFAGYGISSPDRDDYAGSDVRGKIVVVLAGLPASSTELPKAVREQSGRAAKVRNAEAAGARAVIVIYDAPAEDETWRAVRTSVARELTRLDGNEDANPSAVTAVMNRDAGDRLAAALGTRLAALKDAAGRSGFRPRSLGKAVLEAENRLTRFTSANVAGVLRGSQRPDEYVVYLAHWDHLGRCAASGDTICNGAVDNASGVGGLIELARAFTRGARPERSVVFLATTAEERGLLGGKHFASAGPIPAKRMVAAFGLDTIAANGPVNEVIVLGQGLSSLDRWIEAAAAARGRKVIEMPAVQSFFSRSDHAPFAEAGVPATIATGVFAAGGSFQAYMRDHYHKPSDEVSATIDYRGAADDVELILGAGRALANSGDWPAWAKSSPHQRRP